MKLEDCSKQELIYFISRRCFVHTDQLEIDILRYRYEATAKAAAEAADQSCAFLQKYIDLLKPYDGKAFLDIPDDVVAGASEVAKHEEKMRKKSERLYKQCDQIQKQIDACFERERSD